MYAVSAFFTSSPPHSPPLTAVTPPTMPSLKPAALFSLTAAALASSAALPRLDSEDQQQQCRRTQVAIIGAGVAGITAAWALHNASVDDFVIVDRNDYVGGRMAHTTFGTNPETGESYTVELGANWVQGLGSPAGPENPIWTFAKQYNLTNEVRTYSMKRSTWGR